MSAGREAQWQAAPPQTGGAEPRDLEDLEPRRRDQPAQLRAERRYTLNTLMVGAPLTAAFVGLMAADGGVARGAAGSAPAEGAGTAARTAGGARVEPGQSSSAAPDEGLPTGSPSPLLDAGGADTGVFGAAEPVSSGDPGNPGAGIETTPVLIPAQRTLADFVADGADMAGPQISLTFLGVRADVPVFGDQPVDEPIPAPPERGPIGIFSPGTDGDDVIIGTEDDDFLRGGAGDDEIRGLGGDDLLDGGTGNDRLFGGAGDDGLIGGEGDDELHGGTGDDILLAGVGDDQLFGGAGRDELTGDFGDDLLDGGAGNDRLVGGPGDDILVVDDINDVPLERDIGPDGGGNDTLRVEPAFADSLFAFAGVSNAAFRFGIDTPLPDGVDGAPRLIDPDIENVVLQGTADHDVVGDARDNVIRGNTGDNMLHGLAGDDILEGGAGADELLGGAGSDRLSGGADNDILSGATGDDTLRGGAGDDILEGGTGADRLFGGQGNDTFVIGLSEADATDAIFDHEGVNQIRLDGIDGNNVQAELIGDQLRIIDDGNPTPIAVVDDFRGHEDAFSGIDLGDGVVVPIDDILAVDLREQPDPADPEPDDPPRSDDDDMLGVFLTGDETNETLAGTSFNDTIEGGAGKDTLRGLGGDDILSGGTGADRLEGGAGDDTFIIRLNEADATDTILDREGANQLKLEGAEDHLVQIATSGDQLRVIVDTNATPVAVLDRFEDFTGNGQAFAGVWVGETFVETDQLIAGVQPQ